MKKEITLEVNETFSFELESHTGGGYSWSVVSNDEVITEVHIKPCKTSQDIALSPIGKGVPVKVEIKALAKGNAVVRLEEQREWEKTAKPLNICKIIITIK